MSITFIKGNLFNSSCQTLVNTVNCVGVMGKGIALVYRLRYPHLFTEYQRKCRNHEIQVGNLWLYHGAVNTPTVLNFPTKTHWKLPSKLEYIEQGLQFFRQNYQALNITSIAFPLLGAQNGGLPPQVVRRVMEEHLIDCHLPIEIYEHDAAAPDNLFEAFRGRWLSIPPKKLPQVTGIRQTAILSQISEVLANGHINSLVDMLEYDGIGLKTLAKCFSMVMNPHAGGQQTSLF
ncbi:hypothetical protein GCM10011375_32540 [Hymenobacter qilianensis]|uniref:Uncharacterized protein n=2 Tax=Hymenobacter qilianensis TaxID=1385715 RepID=A0ACB5PV71_9BACT|nr:macro domain-containing protein [Hymenobacter qilianensis]QNP51462.1 macro domain-containing protein [Hymenobacter qilianensis]GGF74957.1 hypothetical protein GCM10011375_32540 [Hymenobacter qilianensis]